MCCECVLYVVCVCVRQCECMVCGVLRGVYVVCAHYVVSVFSVRVWCLVWCVCLYAHTVLCVCCYECMVCGVCVVCVLCSDCVWCVCVWHLGWCVCLCML